MKTKSFFLIALMSVVGLSQSCKPKEPEVITEPYSDYFGTWVNADNGGIVTLTANKLVYLNSHNERGYTMEDLTWSPITNSAGSYQTLYPSGYIIKGRVTAIHNLVPPKSDDESTLAEIGDIVIDWWYISTGKGALMWGEWYSEYRQAAFGPYVKK